MNETITRRKFFTRTTGTAALAVFSSTYRIGHGAPPPRRPNIVLILADDLGYCDIGCYGCPDIRTPAIDHLASQGVRFTSFCSNGPECTPTRTALLTGRYQHRVGGLECALGVGNVGRYDDAIRLCEKHELGLPAEETSIARMLKQQGYDTAICGKWHLGYEPKFFPSAHGFDYWFGIIGGSADYFYHCEPNGTPCLYLNGEPVRREGYLTDLLTDEAVRFLEARREKPFFLYVPFNAPHAPYVGPGDRKPNPPPEAEWNKGTRETYVAMVESMDAGIGRILGALDARGLAENTVVIFMSDNGGNKMGNNAPFFGYKGGVFEGGIRVPCAVRWPGVLTAGTESDLPCMTMDFSASIAAIAGASPQPERPFDGVDVLRAVRENQPAPKRALFWRARRGERTDKAVREGDWKYICEKNGDKVAEYLFDLRNDPAEKKNLIGERTEEASRLKNLLSEWEKKVQHVR